MPPPAAVQAGEAPPGAVPDAPEKKPEAPTPNSHHGFAMNSEKQWEHLPYEFQQQFAVASLRMFDRVTVTGKNGEREILLAFLVPGCLILYSLEQKKVKGLPLRRVKTDTFESVSAVQLISGNGDPFLCFQPTLHTVALWKAALDEQTDAKYVNITVGVKDLNLAPYNTGPPGPSQAGWLLLHTLRAVFNYVLGGIWNYSDLEKALKTAKKFCKKRDEVAHAELEALLEALFEKDDIPKKDGCIRGAVIGGYLRAHFGPEWFPHIHERELGFWQYHGEVDVKKLGQKRMQIYTRLFGAPAQGSSLLLP